MAAKYRGHVPRDRLRGPQTQDRVFIPTLTVSRSVLFTPEQARELKQGTYKNLGKRLGSGNLKRYHVIKPEDMKLTVVEGAAQLDQLRNVGGAPDLKKIKRVADLLRGRLAELLAENPDPLTLTLGQLAAFKEVDKSRVGRSRQVVGVMPYGWHGPRARYAGMNDEEEMTPLGLLAAEGAITTETIAEAHEALDPEALLHAPIVPLVESNQIPGKKMRDVNDGLEAALPEAFTFGPPEITMRIGSRRNDVVRIPVLPTDPFETTEVAA